jgi:FtsP/CotA-like multicopper oxidase with cupredoxin domain
MSLATLAALVCCGIPTHARAPARHAPSVIEANDNRQPAGTLRNGVLTVSLEARTGTWYPEGPNGKALTTAAFGEPGRPLQDPGPLLRVPVGTVVKATVRNALDVPMTLIGFGATRGLSDSVVIAPGASRHLQFTASTIGTYYYGATTTRAPFLGRINDGSQLNGAIVVDPVGPVPADRIFLISWWFTLDTLSPTGLREGTMTINGLSWPHTERLDMVQGDSARWRVVNVTGLDHPMHLHGFYFRVDAKGDGLRDTLYTPAQQRLGVTEIVQPGQTMMLSWAATRPGDWIFHCHFAGHLSTLVSLDAESGVMDSTGAMRHMSDRPHQMYGLVLGIHVAPRGTPAPVVASEPRRIRLLVREKPSVYGAAPGYAFVLGGSKDDSTGAMPVPGPTLVLQRGQPVAITVVNESQDHAAVHWHGIELEDSYADGVPGWSGSGANLMRAIPPGDSLTVHFTPPRAGTFMYHSHFNEFHQIPSGLYGALVVVDSTHTLTDDADRIWIYGDHGPTTNVVRGPYPPATMNGDTAPPPLDFQGGRHYRLRLINIRGDTPVLLSLRQGDSLLTWRAVAKDGADLPAGQSTDRPATLLFDPGEIYDFDFTAPATPGTYTLRFGDPAALGPQAVTREVALRVH